jgi:hypothetical protein
MKEVDYMSIDKVNELDLVGTDKQTGDVILTIVDEQDWKDEYNHLLMLQEKINTYLSAIEGGEINEVYPQSIGRKFIINIYFKFNPSTTVEEFLRNVSIIVENAGFKFRWKVVS